MDNHVLITDYLWFQEGPGVRNTQYTSSGVKLLNVANFVDGNIDLSTSSRFISNEEAYGKYKHFLVDEGDFIIASSGIQVAYFEKKMGFIKREQLPLCMNTSTIRFKNLKPSELDMRYFMYYLKSNAFKNQLAQHIVGSAQLNFGPSHLKKMTFPITEMNRQQRIVGRLDKIHSLIALRKEQLAKLDRLVKSRFVEMFGDPEINPYHWGYATIGDLIQSCESGWSGNGTQRIKNPGEIAVLKVSAVTKGYFIPEECKVLDDQNSIKKYVFPEKGDLLFSRANTREMVGATAVVLQDYPELILPDKLWKIRFTHYANVQFMKHILSHRSIRSKFSAVSTGTSGSMFNVSMDKFKAIVIPLPPIVLQEQFADCVNQTNKSKLTIQASLDKLELLKKSLMQQYFG